MAMNHQYASEDKADGTLAGALMALPRPVFDLIHETVDSESPLCYGIYTDQDVGCLIMDGMAKRDPVRFGMAVELWRAIETSTSTTQTRLIALMRGVIREFYLDHAGSEITDDQACKLMQAFDHWCRRGAGAYCSTGLVTDDLRADLRLLFDQVAMLRSWPNEVALVTLMIA